MLNATQLGEWSVLDWIVTAIPHPARFAPAPQPA